MDGSPLDTAYSLVKKAEQATHNGDYIKASTLHLEAAQKFSDAQQLTQSPDAKWMLHSLSQKHISRSKFLNDVKLNEKAIQLQQLEQQQHHQQKKLRQQPTHPAQQLQQHQSPSQSHTQSQPIHAQLIQHEELTSSLASARGIPSSSTITTTPKKKVSEEDPFYKFYSSINNVFTKSFNASIEKSKEEQLQQLQQHQNSISNELNSTITNLMVPMKFDNESFYVVTSKLSTEELTTENANLRQMINRSTIQLHAYEIATKKQKDALKSNLMLLRNEFNSRETARTRQHEAEVEALNSEIDKLKIQIGRLKSRWEDLKANARKRREESVDEDDDR